MPSVATCDNLHLRASLHHKHVSVFLPTKEFLEIF